VIARAQSRKNHWRTLCLTSACAILLAPDLLGTRVASAADPLPSDLVQLRTDESYSGIVRFLLSTRNLLSATVCVTLTKLDNFQSSQPSPVNFMVLKPYRIFEYLRLTQIDPNRQYTYYWHYSYKIGVPSKKTAPSLICSKPYEGVRKVSQSFFGEHSHQRGTESEYAVDFLMPVGTRVRAALPGRVVAFYTDSDRGGSSKAFEHDANQIVIDHGDGTYGCYMHLRQQGVLVKLGQHVDEGDAIALSGNTGWSTEPHLHFMIYRVLSGEKIQTLPFKIRTVGGVVDKPETNASY
jgi:murein DD-endopeptidase MepM/ murein hydrolase activator NlpD